MGKMILLMVFLSGFVVNAAPARLTVQVGISGVYAPGGFDSSTDAYVVVNGVFQNGCYKWDRADVTKISEFNREVRSYASVSQGMCIMVLIPYQKEVRLGQLTTGKHSIKFLNGDGTYIEKNLVVE
ncbi:MAG: hypothetical protein B7Y39_17095 [Bdellovibrio sp. 28-41-41]|nr:MAG: hypothetical protein B7Y39_17095 [Bdellovibrio sp. 28-41-41]